MTTDQITPAKFAVAVLVLRQNGEAWECVQVARKDDGTRWSLPGGKLDPPEDRLLYPGDDRVVSAKRLRFAEPPRAAAVRELREETSIRCLESQLVELETVLDSGGYLTTFYLLAANYPLPDDVRPELHGEADCRWAPIGELFTGPFGDENRARLRKMGIV